MTADTPIRDQIRAYVEETLLGGRSIAPEQDLLTSGLLDSLAVMTLVLRLESLAGIHVRPEHVTIENFISVDAIAAFVARTKAA